MRSEDRLERNPLERSKNVVQEQEWEDVSQASALPEQWKSSAESLAFPWRRSQKQAELPD